MKTFIVSEIIWLIYCVGIVLLTHALLLPVVFYFSGWVIYGLAYSIVRGMKWYHTKLLEKLAEKGLQPGDDVEALTLLSPTPLEDIPTKSYVDAQMKSCGECDC